MDREKTVKKTSRMFMEAHSALSAVLAEEAGFDGIWASGLTISASLGLRDCNEATWTEVLQQVSYMTDRISSPVLLDGDTGYGNFNIARRFAKKAQQIGVWGIVIEDKIFPKHNSFSNYRQSLEPFEKYSAKLRAMRDSVGNDLKIYARCEALNLGCPMEETIERCHLYDKLEIDGLFIHSKKNNPNEVIEFLDQWRGNLEISLIPTTYSQNPVMDFAAYSIENIVYANHLLRSSIQAMEKTCHQIMKTKDLPSKNIASLDRVFELQNENELLEATFKYEQQ